MEYVKLGKYLWHAEKIPGDEDGEGAPYCSQNLKKEDHENFGSKPPKRMPNTNCFYIYVQMLKLVGAGGHYPTNKLQADEAEDSDANAAQPSMTSSSLENLKGRAEALAETGLFAFYKVCFCSLLYKSLRLLFGLYAGQYQNILRKGSPEV